ncbi:MAG: TetR/AcrR family transcriptional regulator [Solirubrobacteraceae bacterium]
MSSVTRRRNPRGEGARLREPLIAAAVELIDELGDASKVSVRAITRRAGVSPTALYLHFPDRDAVVDAAVDAGFEAFNATVIEAAATPGIPREQLRAMCRAYVAFTERQPQLYSVIFSARHTHAGSTSVDRAAGFDTLVDRVAATLGAADEATEVAVAVWSALHGFATLRATGTPKAFPPPAAFVARLLDAHF